MPQVSIGISLLERDDEDCATLWSSPEEETDPTSSKTRSVPQSLTASPLRPYPSERSVTMRPVVIVGSGSPILQYRADTQLNAPAYQGYDVDQRERWRVHSKASVILTLHDVINIWIAAGAPLTSGTPNLSGDPTNEDQYEEFTGLLLKGGKGWGDARRDLIGQIGQYCSYCGSPIFSHLQIEHVLPKTFFPDHIFEWSNFLLACATCNSAKSNAPNQATVPGAPKSTQDAVDYINNKNALNYLWPFADWASLPAKTKYPFRFVPCNLGQLKGDRSRNLRFTANIDQNTVDRLMNLFESGELEHERGLYFYWRGRAKQYFGVRVVVPQTYSRKFARLTAAAKQIVILAKLDNVLKTGDGAKSVDYRIFNRTTAYFRARLLRKRISDACEEGDPGLLTSLIETSRITIKNTGFWPIWLQVLGDIDLNGVGTQAFLRSIFPGTSDIDWLFP
jgi:hypothetical protein